VLVPTGLSRSIRATEQSGPKTVLGFFAAVLGIEAATTVALVVALTATDHAALAAIVLGAAFLIFVGIVGWVLVAMQRDPSRLVVGPMTGREFLDYQRWTAGDSLVGEYEDTVVVRSIDTPVAGELGPAPTDFAATEQGEEE
jgi:hypothetical protein